MCKRVLITPLDWGFGHATRCIPVINMLLRMGHDVHVGGSGASLELLRKEFPLLTFFELPAYAPVYPENGSMVWKMAMQIPHFANIIFREHTAVSKYITAQRIELLISDNRFGCWSERITSVFITHQSNILMPKRFGWLAPAVKQVNAWLMRKFDIWWIPDHPDVDCLAGNLISFGKILPARPVEYVGGLSRFEFHQPTQVTYDVVAICSGPEPQRTMLEEILSAQLQRSNKKYLLIRGVMDDNVVPGKVNYMTSMELQEAILQSRIVISRSGYSTVMDLSALGSKAVFIPTPGQTEQEYLAMRLKEKQICFFMTQEQFDLEAALRESEKYRGFSPQPSSDLLTKAIVSAIEFRRE